MMRLLTLGLDWYFLWDLTLTVWMSSVFSSRLHFVISSSTSWVSCCGIQYPSCGCPSGWPEGLETIRPSTAGLPPSTSSCASWLCPWLCSACRWPAGRSWLASACPSLCWLSLWSLSMWCSLAALATCPSCSAHGSFCPSLCTRWRRGTLRWPPCSVSAAPTAAAAARGASAATKKTRKRWAGAARRVWRCTTIPPWQEMKIQRRPLKQHSFNIIKFSLYL